MKCPKCSYVSHDYLNACRKCRVDLLGFKAQMQLHVVQAGNIDLRSVLSRVQTNQFASGEYDLGETLFDSPVLGASQAEDGFDINLDDDFSFTPSGVSLESLDNFEVSNTEALELGSRRPTSTDSSEAEAPETGYATVMMDISGLSNAGSPPESNDDRLDAPTGLDAPIESAEASVEPLALPVDDAIAAPNPAAGEPRSSLGRASDLDSTSTAFQHTIHDMEIMNPLQNDTLSGDTVLPASDELSANETWHWSNRTERDGMEAFSDQSEALTLPPLDVNLSTTESASSASRASDAQEEPFTMPELSDLGTDEKSVNPISEEFSLDIDTLATPEPTPMEFPSLQTRVSPRPIPEEVTIIYELSTPELIPLRSQDPSGSPKPDTDFFTVTTEETPLADDAPSSSPVASTAAPDAGTSSRTSPTTFELDISDVQSPDEPDWPNLPEQTDALMTTSPNEATIVDEPSPFASSSCSPVAPTITSSEMGPSGEDADDDLDLESLFPNEQPPKKRD